jgi:hypothetical protein
MISLPTRKAWPGLLALVVFILVGVGCKDFFVDPKLTSIAVNADQSSVIIGGTDQLQAVGTYDDSSTKDLTASVKWTANPTGLLSISSTGLATGAGSGSAIVKATSGTISGTTTVVVGSLSSITISPAGSTISKAAIGTQQFTATGHYSDGTTTQDITSAVTWTASTADITFDVATPGLGTIVNSSATPITITATSSAATGAVAGTTTITVNP